MEKSQWFLAKEEAALDLPRYNPSQRALGVLASGRIIAEHETPQVFLERVITTIFSMETQFGTHPTAIKKMAEEFAEYLVDGYAMLGTPSLTNAGRDSFPLSSCALIPVDLHQLNTQTEEFIRAYYKRNMGAGFEFSQYDDPVALLSWLNDFSAREAATGCYERYIGNMGMLHISHPAICSFIAAKRCRDMPHFNISIDVTEDFMARAEREDIFTLADDTKISAAALLHDMAENAWHNGDPGLIFLERMNKDNPVAELPISTYVSTPSCAEMGLARGEACHFSAINLSRFVRTSGTTVIVDYDKMGAVTRLLTRVLDDAIEYSLPRLPALLSREVAYMNRKIAIGVCGLADTLLAHRLPYDSQEGRALARDMLSFINYVSKCASVELAEQRGSCGAMRYPDKNRYLRDRFLEEKYTRRSTRTVSAQQWEQLAERIRSTGKLRHISTTALAPTGRSSILLDTTPAIEPLFSLFGSEGQLQRSVLALLTEELGDNKQLLAQVSQQASLTGSLQQCTLLSPLIRECLKTAKEITPSGHIRMVADIAGQDGVIDESASKTVNLPHSATVEDVQNIFVEAYHLGLKNISVYRDQTKVGQPELL